MYQASQTRKDRWLNSGFEAMQFLIRRGYELDAVYGWVRPNTDFYPDQEEMDALLYLKEEFCLW